MSVSGLTPYTLSSSIFTTTLKDRYCWCPHYTDEKGEVGGPGWDPRQSASGAYAPSHHSGLLSLPLIHHLLFPLLLSEVFLSSPITHSLSPSLLCPPPLLSFSLLFLSFLLSPLSPHTLAHSPTHVRFHMHLLQPIPFHGHRLPYPAQRGRRREEAMPESLEAPPTPAHL